uniref:2,4-dienoyl-CoA reductase n=1 Tax=Kwoniella bestiolae CBS 10118 TaxID=1296100 RepID=A0A1B9FWB9_9TREE|nr:hypothetical protein I302_07423 [Kwoniella bestiolae CBS 10118]OCF23072.1 hypothetical protein I302_07423 [Kwoniella bestiolae CBS 10118]
MFTPAIRTLRPPNLLRRNATSAYSAIRQISSSSIRCSAQDTSSKAQVYGFSRSASIDKSIRAKTLQNLKNRDDNKGNGKGRMEGAVGVITGETPLEELKTWLQLNHPNTKVTTFSGDCSSPQTVQSLINQVVQEEGKLDFFIANAGSFLRPVEEVGGGKFEELVRVNVMSAFLAIKYASQAMSLTSTDRGKDTRGGSIVLTSSIAGLKAKAGTLGYSASKAAINSLTQTAAYDLMGKGVRVNAVAPGLIETDMTKPLFLLAKAGGSYETMGSLNPLQREGLPSEVAHAALFLASNDSSYINGQVSPVDGGLSAGLPYNRSDI